MIHGLLIFTVPLFELLTKLSMLCGINVPKKFKCKHFCYCQLVILAQVRIGVLPLKIDSGRYNNVKVDDRFSELCDLDVED